MVWLRFGELWKQKQKCKRKRVHEQVWCGEPRWRGAALAETDTDEIWTELQRVVHGPSSFREACPCLYGEHEGRAGCELKPAEGESWADSDAASWGHHCW